MIERSDLKFKRTADEICAQIKTVETSDYPVSAEEVHYHSGDASGATGVLQILLAVEHANKNESRSLTHNGVHWRVKK